MPFDRQLRIRLMLGEETALGPGKADLLDAIRHAGSISAAAKSMGMSYRKAWLLVDTMNRCFAAPLVDSAKGGSGGGGAEVTELGETVLVDFRQLQGKVDALVASYMPRFDAQLATSRGSKTAPMARRSRAVSKTS